MLTCAEAYNMTHALDEVLSSLNSQVLEQTNRLIRMHDESMRQMTVDNMAGFMYSFVAWRNRKVAENTLEEVAETRRRSAWASAL